MLFRDGGTKKDRRVSNVVLGVVPVPLVGVRIIAT